MFYNHILVVGIVGWFSAQFIKILIELTRTRKLNWDLLMASGGMPSSHTSFTMATAFAIGYAEGFNTSIFALALVFAFVVMYDASGVRRAAGKQAKIINIIVEKIEHTGITMDEKLKELLGHTHIEVFAGACLGIIVATLMK